MTTKRNLFNELKEGINSLSEKRSMTRDLLLQDYGAIIDKQKKEILDLRAEFSN
jgi:hypothetical protein